MKRDILLKEDGRGIDKKDVAHYINEFFINVGNVNVTDSGDETNSSKGQSNFDGVEGGWTPDSFTVKEVLKVVKEINVSKSSGLQDISSFVIKEVFTILAPQVRYMMN